MLPLQLSAQGKALEHGQHCRAAHATNYHNHVARAVHLYLRHFMCAKRPLHPRMHAVQVPALSTFQKLLQARGGQALHAPVGRRRLRALFLSHAGRVWHAPSGQEQHALCNTHARASVAHLCPAVKGFAVQQHAVAPGRVCRRRGDTEGVILEVAKLWNGHPHMPSIAV
jgi:hypothetical protein